MPVTFVRRFEREKIMERSNDLFVFGDNRERFGLGGQAKECRGCPNAIGIVTKHRPGTEEADYFTDDDFLRWLSWTQNERIILLDHIYKGGTICWPDGGIGTGLAQLPSRAPRISRAISDYLWMLQDFGDYAEEIMI